MTGRKIPRALVLVGTSIIQRLLRAGVPLGPMVLLTVRGRTTGQARTTPVDLFEKAGRRWLVATHGEGNWVRNLRAAGEGILTHGRRRQAVTAAELPPEAAGPVLKEVLGPRLASPLRGFVLRRTLDVAPDAPLDDFIGVARRHPVFELREAQQDPHAAATIEAIRRAHEVLARRDLDEIMTTLTEDVIWETTSPPDGERHVGRDAVQRAMEEFLRGSPQARFETEEVVASGDRAFCTWVYRWTDREGKQGHVRGVDIVRVRDGKIAEMCAYVKG